MTLNQAASGFRNQGQFVAALHVSRNLGIPFADLKTQMVEHHHSLGQSIHSLKPRVDSTGAAAEAEHQATTDLSGTTGTTTTGTTTTGTTTTGTTTTGTTTTTTATTRRPGRK